MTFNVHMGSPPLDDINVHMGPPPLGDTDAHMGSPPLGTLTPTQGRRSMLSLWAQLPSEAPQGHRPLLYLWAPLGATHPSPGRHPWVPPGPHPAPTHGCPQAALRKPRFPFRHSQHCRHWTSPPRGPPPFPPQTPTLGAPLPSPPAPTFALLAVPGPLPPFSLLPSPLGAHPEPQVTWGDEGWASSHGRGRPPRPPSCPPGLPVAPLCSPFAPRPPR